MRNVAGRISYGGKAAVAGLAGLAAVFLSGCAGVSEFASQYEREVRFEYRTENGSASYVIRRPASVQPQDGKAVVR